MSPTSKGNLFCRQSAIGIVVLAAMALLGAVPVAAVHIETTAELRDACELSPDHVVVLDHSTKILEGFRPPATEQVDSRCTLVLGPGANLAVERVSMTFAGPLVVQSAQKGEVKLDQSFLTAASMTFNLAGTGSALVTTRSSLHASDGSLLLAFGDEGNVEILERLLPGPENGLAAARRIQIRGGRKFLGVLGDTSVNAPLGFRVDMNGADGVFKVDEVIFSASQGSIAITASGAKGLVEMHKANFWFGDAVSMRLAGSESAIKLKQVVVGSFSTGVAPGGVTIEAGEASASLGSVEASEVSIFDVASVAMLASRTGIGGVLKLEKSFVSATGDVVMESGSVTEVKENDVTSETWIRVASGPGGACVAQPNNFVAPVVEACP